MNIPILEVLSTIVLVLAIGAPGGVYLSLPGKKNNVFLFISVMLIAIGAFILLSMSASLIAYYT